MNTLVKRVVFVFTFAAGQMLITIQGLSLISRLDGLNLAIWNCLVTMLVVGIFRFLPRGDRRLSWGVLLKGAWNQIASQKSDGVLLALFGVAALSLCLNLGMGEMLNPFGDSYHFEMPQFWIQNHTIAPFPVNNPRINTTSFVGEALVFPGYLYLHTANIFAVLTLFACVIDLAIVFALARRIGCDMCASLCAVPVVLGFPLFVLTLHGVIEVGSYLAAMWIGAAIVFLIDARPLASVTRTGLVDLGCLIICFVMACGAKNTAIMLAPVYVIALLAVYRGFVLKPSVVTILSVCGCVALLSSGVAWNYAVNKIWYGNSRDPS